MYVLSLQQTGTSAHPGPENCPRFELGNQDIQILVPANTRRPIAVHAIAMQASVSGIPLELKMSSQTSRF